MRSALPAVRPVFSSRTSSGGGFSAEQRLELANVLRNLDKLENALTDGGVGRRSSTTSTPPLEPTPTAPPFVLSGTSVALDAAQPDQPIGSSEPPRNLIVNPGFEENRVRDGGHRLIKKVNGWQSSMGRIEVWRNLRGYTPAEGDQWIELDAGRPGIDEISQSVATTPGQTYTLSFAYSPRPGVGAASNEVELLFDGEVLDAIAEDGRGLSDTNWRVRHVQVQATSELSTISLRETSSDSLGTLIDSVSFVESRPTDGPTSVDNPLAEEAPERSWAEAVVAGEILINGTAVAIDPESDSLGGIVEAINAADAGVGASLVATGESTADGRELYRVELASEGSYLELDDNGTGLLAALGIASGGHGERLPEPDPDAGEGGPGGGGRDADALARQRAYRAADALEEIRASFEALLADRSAVGRALGSTLASIFERTTADHGERRLDGLGLRLAEAADGFFSITKTSRREFAKAVWSDERALDRVLLGKGRPTDEGLIETLREVVKAQLQGGGAGGGTLGSIVDRFA